LEFCHASAPENLKIRVFGQPLSKTNQYQIPAIATKKKAGCQILTSLLTQALCPDPTPRLLSLKIIRMRKKNKESATKCRGNK